MQILHQNQHYLKKNAIVVSYLVPWIFGVPLRCIGRQLAYLWIQSRRELFHHTTATASFSRGRWSPLACGFFWLRTWRRPEKSACILTRRWSHWQSFLPPVVRMWYLESKRKIGRHAQWWFAGAKRQRHRYLLCTRQGIHEHTEQRPELARQRAELAR